MITKYNDKRTALGKIIGPHGLKGALKLKSFMQIPKDIFDQNNLYDEFGNTVSIKLMHSVKNNFVIAVSNVNTRDEAEAFGKPILYADRKSLTELTANEHYIDDLVGLSVIFPDGVIAGSVENVENYGGGDFLTIKSTNGSIATVAFREPFIEKVDILAGIITIRAGSLLVDKKF